MRKVLWSLSGLLLLVVLAVAGGLYWGVGTIAENLIPPPDPKGQASIASYSQPAPETRPEGLPLVRDFSWDSLLNPPKSARPWTRWWWPGGAVDTQTLMAQIELLDGANFGGAEIQASAMGIADVTDPEQLAAVYSFDSPEYYKTLDQLLTEVAAYDWQIDLTHLSGWPPGGPQVNLADSMTALVYGETEITGGKTVTLSLPKAKPTASKYALATMELGVGDFVNFAADQATLISVIAAKKVGGSHSSYPFNLNDTEQLNAASIQVLTSQVNDGKLRWDAPEGEWKIIASYAMPSGEVPINGAQQPKGFVIDHLRSQQVLGHYDYAFGARTGLPKHYGKSLRGFFNDSLEFRLSRMGAVDILQEFKARRGYDLEPYLPAVYVDGIDDLYFGEVFGVHAAPEFKLTDLDERIRYDYQRTLSDLMIERFVETSASWAESRGLTSRNQSYGVDIDILRALGANSIPETEQLWDGGSRFVLKMASSAAALYGKPLASAESFVWRGYDYTTTARKIKAAADKLFLAGINHIVYHGTPYPWMGGDPSPYGDEGWSPFSSPDNPGHFSSIVSPRNTALWPDIKALNNYIARSQNLLRQGVPVVDVLVYYPFLGYRGEVHDGEALINGAMPDYDGAELATDPLKQLQDTAKAVVKVPPAKADPRAEWLKSIAPVLKQFDDNGITWGWVNAHALESGLVKSGALVSSGGEYQAILLPNVHAMDMNTLERVSALAKADGNLFFYGATPTRQLSFNKAEHGDASIKRNVQEIIASGAPWVEKDINALVSGINAKRVSPVEVTANKGIRLYSRKLDATSQLVFFANQSPNAEDVQLKLRGQQQAWWFDALEGKVWNALEDGQNPILKLSGFSSRFLIIGRDMPDNLPQQLTSEETFNRADRQWNLSSWNLSDGEQSIELKQLTDWRDLDKFKYSRGPGLYAHTFVLPEKQASAAYILNLGLVHGSTLVRVNGQAVSRASIPPFTVDVSPFLQQGNNSIEIEVLPPLINSFIRKGMNEDPKYNHMVRTEQGLFAAGLMGPVVISETLTPTN